MLTTTRAHIKIGSSPTATTSDPAIGAYMPEYFIVAPGMKASAIRVTTNGTLHVSGKRVRGKRNDGNASASSEKRHEGLKPVRLSLGNRLSDGKSRKHRPETYDDKHRHAGQQ